MTEKRFKKDRGTFWDNNKRLNMGETVDLLNTLHEENEQLKLEYEVLRTQYQDLKKFVENNFDEHLTREKLNRQIIKLSDENEQLKQSTERIIKDIDLALGFIRHKGYSLQDIKDYEDAKKEYEEDLAYYRKGDVE